MSSQTNIIAFMDKLNLVQWVFLYLNLSLLYMLAILMSLTKMLPQHSIIQSQPAFTCSKLTIETLEPMESFLILHCSLWAYYSRYSSGSIFNFGQVSPYLSRIRKFYIIYENIFKKHLYRDCLHLNVKWICHVMGLMMKLTFF